MLLRSHVHNPEKITGDFLGNSRTCQRKRVVLCGKMRSCTARNFALEYAR